MKFVSYVKNVFSKCKQVYGYVAMSNYRIDDVTLFGPQSLRNRSIRSEVKFTRPSLLYVSPCYSLQAACLPLCRHISQTFIPRLIFWRPFTFFSLT